MIGRSLGVDICKPPEHLAIDGQGTHQQWGSNESIESYYHKVSSQKFIVPQP